jgi:hypothetical protein
MLTEEKVERVRTANQVIVAIASYGRRFFYCVGKGTLARFQLSERGDVLFVDDYTEHPVPVIANRTWRGFSHGGGLRALVEALGVYIRTGKPISRDWFDRAITRGDGSDIWGYGAAAMEAVRVAVFPIPAVEQPYPAQAA